jgi:hypothetical protein
MKQLIGGRLLYGVTLFAAVGSLLAGCTPASTPPASSARIASPAANDSVRQDLWDVLFFQGGRVGYTHTVVEPTLANGRKLLRINSTSKLSLKRFGQVTEQNFEMESLESPEGQLVEFKTVTAMGPTPMLTTGKLDDRGNLKITMSAGEKSTTTEIAWSPKYRGIFGAERELSERPMVEGDSREFRTLVPVLNQLAAVKLVARGKEPTRLLDGTEPELMRIDSITTLADGNELATAIWTDDTGKTLKTRTEAMQQETYRTTERVARTEATAAQKFDLGFDTMIPIDIPATSLHAAGQARYRLTLDRGDPVKAFVNCPQQTVKSLGPDSAELVVRSIRPETPLASKTEIDRPQTADAAPNALIQSDDPRVESLANSVARQTEDPWQIAVALEKLVHDTVNEKNFSQAFASAAEVAESREGDCSEHAVLLAALLRARGIPARVAAGLVYVEAAHAFGYHMWTEAFIRDRWIPLDATLAKGGIGAGHLKLFSSNLNGTGAYSSFLPVAQVLGRLKIKLIEAK